YESNFASFFFQAEDSIRYFHVTGVQTCALPISEQAQARRGYTPLSELKSRLERFLEASFGSVEPTRINRLRAEILNTSRQLASRTEERRVGKERRSGASWKEKKQNIE